MDEGQGCWRETKVPEGEGQEQVLRGHGDHCKSLDGTQGGCVRVVDWRVGRLTFTWEVLLVGIYWMMNGLEICYN